MCHFNHSNQYSREEGSAKSKPTDKEIEDFVNGTNISSSSLRGQGGFIPKENILTNTEKNESVEEHSVYTAREGSAMDDYVTPSPSSFSPSDIRPTAKRKKGKHKSRLLRIKNNTGCVYAVENPYFSRKKNYCSY